jgi:hypothetical protein
MSSTNNVRLCCQTALSTARLEKPTNQKELFSSEILSAMNHLAWLATADGHVTDDLCSGTAVDSTFSLAPGLVSEYVTKAYVTDGFGPVFMSTGPHTFLIW